MGFFPCPMGTSHLIEWTCWHFSVIAGHIQRRKHFAFLFLSTEPKVLETYSLLVHSEVINETIFLKQEPHGSCLFLPYILLDFKHPLREEDSTPCLYYTTPCLCSFSFPSLLATVPPLSLLLMFPSFSVDWSLLPVQGDGSIFGIIHAHPYSLWSRQVK